MHIIILIFILNYKTIRIEISYVFCKIIFFALAFFSNLYTSSSSNIKNILQSIENQDLKKIKEIKIENLSLKEQDEIFLYDYNLSQKLENQAWFSTKSKKSFWSILCVISYFQAFDYFIRYDGYAYFDRRWTWWLYPDSSIKISKTYAKKSFYSSLAYLTLAIFTGYECENGYFQIDLNIFKVIYIIYLK